MLKQIRKRKREMIRQKIQQPLMRTTAATINHLVHRSQHQKKVTLATMMMTTRKKKRMKKKKLIMPARMVQMRQLSPHRKLKTKMKRAPATKKLKIGSFFSTPHSHTQNRSKSINKQNTCWRWPRQWSGIGAIKVTVPSNDSDWGFDSVSNACAWNELLHLLKKKKN